MTHRSTWLIRAAIMWLVALPVAAADIQVTCPPGLEVFLDGRRMGTCNEREDGLVLLAVPRGSHTVRVEREGFLPQVFEVRVESSPIELKVPELVPAPVVEPPGPQQAAPAPGLAGALVLTSAPQSCTVEVDGVAHEKTTPELRLDGLTASYHDVTFRKPGFAPVSGTVKVLPGGIVTVRGNLFAGELEVVHSGKGSLRLTSRPQRCTVRLLGRVEEKTQPKLNLSHLPAGEHRLRVSIPGRELETTVVILDGMRTLLEVSFLPGDQPFVVSYVPLR